MTTDECDDAIGVELGAKDVIDPLASPTSRSSPGPQTPPQFMDADIDVPSIALPAAFARNPRRGSTPGNRPTLPHAHHIDFNVGSQHPVLFQGTRICRQLDKGHPDVWSISVGPGDPTPRMRTGSMPIRT